MQRRALRQGKNLVFIEDTCLKKERARSNVTPRKVKEGLKRRWELNKQRWGLRLAWWGSTEKKKASHLLERKTPILRPAIQSNQCSLCVFTSVETEG